MPRARLASVVALLGVAVCPQAARATTAGPLTELTASPAGADQRAPAIAWDATQSTYLLVWEDERTAANGVDLYAARISASGALNPADSSGCPIVTAPTLVGGDETQPSVAALGAGAFVVAYADGGSGLGDVYAARVLAATCTAQTPVAITSGADVETSPAVAASGAGALVTWQVNLTSGAQRVRARRYDSSLSPVDGAAVDLGAVTAGRPAAAAVGADYFVGYESGGDVSLVRVASGGPLSPSSPLAVSSGPLSQSRLQVAPLGAGLVTVWQDARAGAGAEDVYGRRIRTNLTAAGSEQPVSAAPAAQLAPAVAGDPSRGLSIWQDRRNGSVNAIVYGARLDPATGASLDGDGFPVLVLPGNAFEPAVAKGPGADYLVAAVRFGSPSRIYYRVVRDEPPAGTLGVSGGGSAPADGSTPVALTFTGAAGASGLPVVDGTRYTVTLSQPAAQVLQADVDPATPGHQVGAANGEVRVSVVSTSPGACDVQLASVEGSATGSAQVSFTNGPPSASLVVIGPASPSSGDDLTLSYTYSDPEGDPESGTSIQWTRNAAVQPAFADQATVPASATRRGDQWRARVIPSDGAAQGTPAFSNTLTITNGPPVATAVAIRPASDVRSGTALNGTYTYADPDADPEVGSVLRWRLDGALQADLQGLQRVPAGRVDKGQTWRFEVEPSDGLATGAVVASDPVTIVNTAPVARAGADASVPERARFTLDGAGSSDRDPQDVLQFSWQQLVVGGEPEVALSSTSSPTPSFVAPSVEVDTPLTFELEVSDGEATSGASRVRVTVIAAPDGDADGLDDVDEAAAGTDPARADTDRDGLDDGRELRLGADPLDLDSDDDGVRDGEEGRSCASCEDFEPDADVDGDGVIAALDPDDDGDGVQDGTELGVREPKSGGGEAPYVYAGTDPAAFVADADPDTSTDPRREDTDGDGLTDGEEDTNANGRVDPGETDPADPEDPPVACGEANPCPGALVCVDGRCRAAEGTDGGVEVCSPLPDSVMCCEGGCEAGSPAEPICVEPGAREVCPVGAELCVVGACVEGPPSAPQPAEGCRCLSTPRGAANRWALLALLGLAVGRRRRHASSAASRSGSPDLKCLPGS